PVPVHLAVHRAVARGARTTRPVAEELDGHRERLAVAQPAIVRLPTAHRTRASLRVGRAEAVALAVPVAMSTRSMALRRRLNAAPAASGFATSADCADPGSGTTRCCARYSSAFSRSAAAAST